MPDPNIPVPNMDPNKLVLTCKFSEQAKAGEFNWFFQGDGSVPQNERLVLAQEGRKVELNLTLEASGEYSCFGSLPGSENDTMSIRSVKNITVYEKARQLSDDHVSNQDMDINPLSIRKGEWSVTWNYDDRPDIQSIEISYMKKSLFQNHLRIGVSVTFYRGDDAFEKKKYRIKDIFIDADYGIKLLARDEAGQIQHQIVVARTNSKQTFGPMGSDMMEKDDNEMTTMAPKKEPQSNVVFLLILGAVIFLIIDLVSCLTKKCGLFHFIYQTTCGDPLGKQKEDEEQSEDEEGDEENEEKKEGEESEEKKGEEGEQRVEEVKEGGEEKQEKKKE